MHEQKKEGKKKLDLRVIFGQDEGGQELLKVQAVAQFQADKIDELCVKTDIKSEQVGEDTILKIDFLTVQGRQKEAIQYFQNGLDLNTEEPENPNLSALQQLFQRPINVGKLTVSQSKRIDGKKGVTLSYKFYKEKISESEDYEQIKKIIDKAQFSPEFRLNINFKGFIQTSKKNRIKLKINHITNHFYSEDFNAKSLLTMLYLLNTFEQEEEAQMILKNPLFKLLIQSEHIQGTLKMASIRKFVELYKLGLTQNYTENIDYFCKKYPPEVINGLFKSQIRITLIHAHTLGLSATINYESQAIMSRFLTGMKKHVQMLDGY